MTTVWKLDRLSRSLKDVLHIMDRIADAGAGFRSVTENIDTTTPAGRMMMQMVGSFAEFERSMIRERTSAGIAAARAEGRVISDSGYITMGGADEATDYVSDCGPAWHQTPDAVVWLNKLVAILPKKPHAPETVH